MNTSFRLAVLVRNIRNTQSCAPDSSQHPASICAGFFHMSAKISLPFGMFERRVFRD